MAITPLPPAPSRASPSDFSTKADALLGALATFVSEANAQAAALDLNDTTATSTTSLAIGTGSKSLTVDVSKSYQPGMSIKIARTSSPSNWMHGDVTSYNAGTGALVVNVTTILGSGTYTDWTVTFSAPAAVVFASAAEDLAGAEAAKAIAPLTNPQLIKNLKLVVNASVNKLDIFTKSGGAVPDASNIIVVAIPDGNGYTFRSRAAAYLSGTSQFIMADAANYWSKGSLDAEIKNAYIYAIWAAAGGIVWALGGYSGFTRVPASTTATDDDFFLLEAGSTYTKVITDYCARVGKIRYQYNTADTPDHTIQATVLDAPQVMWNPKSDYGYSKNLATTLVQGSEIVEYSAISIILKQSGKYNLIGSSVMNCSGGNMTTNGIIKTGSATYASATTVAKQVHDEAAAAYQINVSPSKFGVMLNAGDTIHLGLYCNGASGNRSIFGDNTYVGATSLSFCRID
jgi:hypothetical protein